MTLKQIILLTSISAPIMGCFKPIVFNPMPNPLPTTTTAKPKPTGTTTTTNIPSSTGTKPTGTTTTNTPTDAENIGAGKLPADINAEDKAPNTVSYVNFFKGVARKGAKTSVSPARTEIFEGVGDLLVTLPIDDDMHKYSPKIKQITPRVPEEDRNVYIKNAYMFSVKEEEDQDFHVIIGDLSATGEPINLMNVEIAGLPEDVNSKDFKILKKVRAQFYAKYPLFFDSNKKTMTCDPPVPISLRGSLFFDTQHSAGNIGSKKLKPLSVWEIHPITYIKFR